MGRTGYKMTPKHRLRLVKRDADMARSALENLERCLEKLADRADKLWRSHEVDYAYEYECFLSDAQKSVGEAVRLLENLE